MIEIEDYLALLREAIPRLRSHPPNPQQETCLRVSASDPLMVVAGPGSGKTTVLVLRAWRLVLVDQIMPESILITTFTRKAAEEIRSRLIEWGLALLDHLKTTSSNQKAPGFSEWLESIDVCRFITGTLDSVCEDVLTTHREPGDAPPVLVEGFVGNALLARRGMFPSGARTSTELNAYLAQFTPDGSPPKNFGRTVDLCRVVVDRLIHDRVDIDRYRNGVPHQRARQVVAESLEAYQQYMVETNRMDFAALESEFLSRLEQGRLKRFSSAVKAVLVDEYQDTNPLQESIYLALAQHVQSITVVGDDDQSLYRFRGATVELFRHFPDRLASKLPQFPSVQMKYLYDNYRSTPEIVSFFNDHIALDADFSTARVQPPKPEIVAKKPPSQMPVIGMFRPDAQTLAHDLSVFLCDIFAGDGRVLRTIGHEAIIQKNENGGNFADAVLLGHTVNELAPARAGSDRRNRLPLLLRRELADRGIGVFNPRGEALRDVPEVQRLLGLILLCIDPNAMQQSAALLRLEARNYMDAWRRAALSFVDTNPRPNQPRSLASFVDSWQLRRSQTQETTWPDEWPILELCYKLVSWTPFFQYDPEGQVYLEAISRCIAQAATVSAYRGAVFHARPPHDEKSVASAIWDIFVPLAENGIEVDEEIMPHIPRNRLPIMTIHQSKGLEFPLVIVDVSSDYTIDHRLQRFRRFPDKPNPTQLLEDDIADYCYVGSLRRERSALERSFDDLRRLYYVAYSRAQSVLMLVGIDRCLQYRTSVRHVATGWRPNKTWAWLTPVSGKSPAMVNDHPLELI